MMGLEDSMASAHRILSSVPGNNRSSGSPTAGLSRQMLKTELKDQASRVAAQCNSMNTQVIPGGRPCIGCPAASFR